MPAKYTSSALLFTFKLHFYSDFLIMYRCKILFNSFSKFKPKIRNNIIPIGPRRNSQSLVNQQITCKNIERANLFKDYLEPLCWNCKKTLKMVKFTCSECGALQPPETNINYFELLGISQTFDINVEDMAEKFRTLQMLLHPDKVENKSKHEKEISEIYSRLLNKAYKTLKDPVSRGFYLLEQSNVTSKDHNPLDQSFLSIIMEKNEELETLDNLSALNEFYELNNKQIEDHFSFIQKAFCSNDFTQAQINLLRLNYLVRLNDKVKEKVDKIKSSDGK